MPKTRKSRSKRAPTINFVALFLFLSLAALLAWFVLRPASHSPRWIAHHVVTATPLAQASPGTEESPPSQTESPPQSEAPSVTPVASVSALPPAAPSAGNPNAPKLALIIDDCGQWIETERGFVALSVPLTLSVLPDVHFASTIAREASDAGKGVMLHLPMETLSGLNPGPGKVTTAMSDEQIMRQVQDDLAQVPLATGVNNHEGSKASADLRVMRDVMDVLSKHGNLFFIDSRTNAASVGEQTATAAGIPTASRDVFLDNKADVAYSEAQLREAAAIAKRNGSAIAIGHPRATTLEAVRALIPELQAEGIEFVLAQDLTR